MNRFSGSYPASLTSTSPLTIFFSSLIKSAADKGDSFAQERMGLNYFNGTMTCLKDMRLARKYFQMAADQDFHPGTRVFAHLGNFFLQGTGGPKNEKKAVIYYKIAAERGCFISQYNLAYFYKRAVPDDKACFHYFKMAAQNPSSTNRLWSEANTMLGLCYFNGIGCAPDLVRAYHYFTIAAKYGDTEGMLCLSDSLAGAGGCEPDKELAFEWLKEAAKSGKPEALCKLGESYFDGIGTPVDFTLAAKFLEQAAEKKNPAAQARLGFCYMTGRGVQVDPQKATTLFRLSAEKGGMEAQFHLATCYRDGFGVNKDDKAAFRYELSPSCPYRALLILPLLPLIFSNPRDTRCRSGYLLQHRY